MNSASAAANSMCDRWRCARWTSANNARARSSDCSSNSTRSMTSASTSSVADGRNRSVLTTNRIAASRRNGLRSSSSPALLLMTTRGKIVLTILVLGVVGLGVWKWWDKLATSPRTGQQAQTGSDDDKSTPAALVETQIEVPPLAAPAVYQPKDNVVDVELSEYAGYAGFIVANGGLEPNENSLFFKKHGFKVRIKLSEEESWSALNSGKMAASATTVDVLAVYGKQFHVVVPGQIGFSRGADGVVVRSDIKRINGLRGKTLATAQFTEADFFIRYLAQEAGVGINMLPDLKARPEPDKLNLVFCEDAFAAGDLFLEVLKAGG